MHTLGCADLHNTIFFSIGARVTEFLPIEDIGSPRVHCCFTNTALVYASDNNRIFKVENSSVNSKHDVGNKGKSSHKLVDLTI